MKRIDKIQNFGRALSAMVMPNIGAFIAWGLITAIFMPTGWWPNATIDHLREPLLNYLLPLLIGYTGGYNVAGKRGGVIGAISTAGVVVGGNVPMFVGAMIMGPLSAWIIKKFDEKVEGHIRPGFEMLVDNFSLGIIGMILAIIGFLTLGNTVTWLSMWVGEGIKWLMMKHLLPLVSVIIEPAKVMFLNNAVNHGILTPLGVAQAEEFGKSIIFMLESNPGPGFGMLMAYWVFGKGIEKSSAPGAVLIQFIGGIHEIYYPYVFSRPRIIIAPICGSSACILFLLYVKAGLIGVISPGSIISVILMSPRGETLLLVSGVLIAAIVSFLISAPIIKNSSAVEKMAENKFTPKYKQKHDSSVKKSCAEIHHIIFACDAGMGSSALAASSFQKRLKQITDSVSVKHASVSSVPQEADVVVCLSALVGRAEHSAPWAEIIPLENFLQDPALDELLSRFSKNERELFSVENIYINQKADDKFSAIRMVGEALVKGGYVNRKYIDAMIERENVSSVYMGQGVALPHGTEEAKLEIISSGIVVFGFPQGVDFEGEKAYILLGVAGKGDDHMKILEHLGETLEDEEKLSRLLHATTKEDIYEILK
ncbi:MAG: PTS sugar transporter subunit IIA [Alistipes sp.]|nr:PTS sugar transporter subunit IIA [Candidatus Alistipes equi]